jgi:hypothetical protein
MAFLASLGRENQTHNGETESRPLSPAVARSRLCPLGIEEIARTFR